MTTTLEQAVSELRDFIESGVESMPDPNDDPGYQDTIKKLKKMKKVIDDLVDDCFDKIEDLAGEDELDPILVMARQNFLHRFMLEESASVVLAAIWSRRKLQAKS